MADYLVRHMRRHVPVEASELRSTAAFADTVKSAFNTTKPIGNQGIPLVLHASDNASE